MPLRTFVAIQFFDHVQVRILANAATRKLFVSAAGDVLHKSDRSTDVADTVVSGRACDDEPAAEGSFFQQCEEFVPDDLAATNRDFDALSVDVSQSVPDLHGLNPVVQDAVRFDGIVAAHDQAGGIEIQADRSFCDFLKQSLQLLRRIDSGRDGERRADVVRVAGDIVQHVHQQPILRRFNVFWNSANSAGQDWNSHLPCEFEARREAQCSQP